MASALFGASGKTVLPCRTLKCVRGPAAALSVRSKKRTASKFGPDARESLHQDLDAKRGIGVNLSVPLAQEHKRYRRGLTGVRSAPASG